MNLTASVKASVCEMESTAIWKEFRYRKRPINPINKKIIYPINKKNATIELEQLLQSGSIFHVCCENDTQCTKPSVQFPFARGSTCPTGRLV